MSFHPSLRCGVTLAAALLLQHPAPALSQQPAISPTTTQDPDAQIVTTSDTNLDDRPQPAVHDSKATPGQKLADSWSMLTFATQSHNADTRIQALAALGTLGSTARSSNLIVTAMADPDLDVRTAAILAAVETKNRNLTTNIRNLLNDKEPQVAFTAATTLWKLNDRSGEDILVAVINGDRSANPTLMNGTMHDMNKRLHHPADLAKMGAMQGIYMMIGPFGFGLTALQYMHKNGGDLARVSAIQQISEENTAPVRKILTSALSEKDPAVRAAAAKALGSEHDKELATPLYALLDDPRQPVRLTAAAACINVLQPSPNKSHLKFKR